MLNSVIIEGKVLKVESVVREDYNNQLETKVLIKCEGEERSDTIQVKARHNLALSIQNNLKVDDNVVVEGSLIWNRLDSVQEVVVKSVKVVKDSLLWEDYLYNYPLKKINLLTGAI